MTEIKHNAGAPPGNDTASSDAWKTLGQRFRLSHDFTLNNRILMAPMTRCMAGPGLVVVPASAPYYARRAEAGLIITEATIIRPDGQGYPDTPGICSEAQIEGWRAVTQAVHDAGGRIFLQLWHVGRVSHPIYLDGELPIAPSAVKPEGKVSRQENLEFVTPRALALDEIPKIAADYGQAAANAVRAGFDGVEIHGANGYLIDQFLHHRTNRRDDAYGGSPASNSRFALEVMDAVIAQAGAGRTGIRLSPGAYHYMKGHPDDAAVFQYLLKEIERRRLAYVHLGIFDDGMTFEELGGQQASTFLRAHYDGTLVGCGSYSPEAAATAIRAGRFDLIAMGRPFIANPDLVARVHGGFSLRPYDGKMLKTLD